MNLKYTIYKYSIIEIQHLHTRWSNFHSHYKKYWMVDGFLAAKMEELRSLISRAIIIWLLSANATLNYVTCMVHVG